MTNKTIKAFEYLGWISLVLFIFTQLISDVQNALPIVFLITTLLFSIFSGILAMYKEDAPKVKLTIRRLFPSFCIITYLAIWMFRIID